MELADAIVVNKADGDNLTKAQVTCGEYERMVEFVRPATEGWKTHAYCCSALKKTGLLELWAVMRKFEKVYFYKLSAWNSPMDSIYAKP